MVEGVKRITGQLRHDWPCRYGFARPVLNCGRNPTEDSCRHLRCYRSVHVTCSNTVLGNRRAVWRFLQEHQERSVLHFLAKYAPEASPIERVWCHLHVRIPRNDRTKTLEELLGLVPRTRDWLEGCMPFRAEGGPYGLRALT